MKKIILGTNRFSKLIREDGCFVDKTLMIKDFLERKKQVTIITRPRLFGKTINITMMSEFFDNTKDSKKLFKGTKIMDTSYASEINQYPTLFFSFSNARSNKKTIISEIRSQIINEWTKYDFVFTDLNKDEKIKYEACQHVLINWKDDDFIGITDVISFLIERLEIYYGKKVMLFIDEYDTPFIEAYRENFYDEIEEGITHLFMSILNKSSSLKYAMLIGIQTFANESIFSKLDNVIVCDVSNQIYAPYFGFDEKETKQLLEYYHLEFNEEVKEVYDGYCIGNIGIYNTWSILNYVNSKELRPFWINTALNKMLKDFFNKSDDNFKKQYEQLIANGYLETRVTLQTSFYEVANTSNLWGLFVNAGYLTVDEIIDIADNYCRIRIPNNEVKTEFRSLTEYYLSLYEGQLNQLSHFLINEQFDEFSKYYQHILMLPSYHDLNNENSYHMMMLGMCLCLSDNYKIISNREEGKGRCDIIIQAHYEKKTSFVIEFKYFKEDKKDVEKALDKLSNEAIQQIKDRRYDYDLKGKVIYIGLAHHGKDVMMKWEEKVYI
ncbi:AAA family ATPase [Faecalibacillus faecis]|uniref:AAA family ATPase n=1 Tax=Faecalibacillus faecis TaxID=1982628 RepID=UPI002F922D49